MPGRYNALGQSPGGGRRQGKGGLEGGGGAGREGAGRRERRREGEGKGEEEKEEGGRGRMFPTFKSDTFHKKKTAQSTRQTKDGNPTQCPEMTSKTFPLFMAWCYYSARTGL